MIFADETLLTKLIDTRKLYLLFTFIMLAFDESHFESILHPCEVKNSVQMNKIEDNHELDRNSWSNLHSLDFPTLKQLNIG